jgi:O-antigen ligase
MFNLINTKLLLISLIPIGLLISSGVADSLLIFSVIIFIHQSIINKNFIWLKDKCFILFCVFNVYLLINFFLSQSQELSFSRTFGFIRFPLFLMSVKYFYLKDFSLFDKHIKIWNIIIIIVLIDTFIQYFYGKNILGYPFLRMGDDVIRLSSFLGKEYKIGGYLLIFCSIILSYFFSNNNIYTRIYALIFFSFSFCAIYLTGERSNFFIFFIISFLFFLTSNLKSRLKIYLMFFLIFFSIFVINYNEKLKQRMIYQTLAISGANDGNAILNSHYGAHYITAFQIFKDYPFFGSGSKTFRIVCENEKYNNYNIPFIKNRCSTHPHNFILEVLSELGLLGLFFLSLPFIYIFLKKINLFFKTKNNLLLGLILTSMFFYFPFIPRGSFFNNWNSVLFWTVLSLLISFKSNPKCNSIKK